LSYGDEAIREVVGDWALTTVDAVGLARTTLDDAGLPVDTVGFKGR